MTEIKRNSKGELVFDDHPEFKPNLSPEQIFRMGSFGGTYWRPIYSAVADKNYKNKHHEFDFLSNIDENKLTRDVRDLSINKYKVNSGTTLEFWESKGWIHKQDPYGWVQWYCKFYAGRRSTDDERQIKRWLAFTGPNGRFKKELINKINKLGSTHDDYDISPVIRQGLQHWGYKLKKHDLN